MTCSRLHRIRSFEPNEWRNRYCFFIEILPKSIYSVYLYTHIELELIKCLHWTCLTWWKLSSDSRAWFSILWTLKRCLEHASHYKLVGSWRWKHEKTWNWQSILSSNVYTSNRTEANGIHINKDKKHVGNFEMEWNENHLQMTRPQYQSVRCLSGIIFFLANNKCEIRLFLFEHKTCQLFDLSAHVTTIQKEGRTVISSKQTEHENRIHWTKKELKCTKKKRWSFCIFIMSHSRPLVN